MLSSSDSERGQILVLFVAIFSVVLILLAFAVDQGFWYGRRRVAQGDVDAAARAGAFGYFERLSDTSAARARALEASSKNGANGAVAIANANSCQGQSGIPSVTVQVENNVPGLFSRFALGGGISIGARATACVGGVETLEVDNIGNPPPSGNLLKGLPIALQHDVDGSCFDGSDDLVVGRECALLDDLDESGDRRTLMVEPSNNECEGNGGNADPFDIAGGIEFKCEVRSGNSCSGFMQCVRVDTTNRNDQAFSLIAMAVRFNGAPNCDSSFSAAFGGGDAPPKFGGSSSDRDRVYVQTGCFSSRRLVVLPVVEDSGGSSPRNVRGFATVYITGCYRDGVSMDSPNVPLKDPDDAAEDCFDAGVEMLTCDDDDDDDDCDDGDDDWEIRGVPINMYITKGSTGGLVSTERNSALTVQTVQ